MFQCRINISERAGGPSRKRLVLKLPRRERCYGYPLHELECCTRAPWEDKRALEYVSEQYVIGRVRLKESAWVTLVIDGREQG